MNKKYLNANVPITRPGIDPMGIVHEFFSWIFRAFSRALVFFLLQVSVTFPSRGMQCNNNTWRYKKSQTNQAQEKRSRGHVLNQAHGAEGALLHPMNSGKFLFIKYIFFPKWVVGGCWYCENYNGCGCIQFWCRPGHGKGIWGCLGPPPAQINIPAESDITEN